MNMWLQVPCVVTFMDKTHGIHFTMEQVYKFGENLRLQENSQFFFGVGPFVLPVKNDGLLEQPYLCCESFMHWHTA